MLQACRMETHNVPQPDVASDNELNRWRDAVATVSVSTS